METPFFNTVIECPVCKNENTFDSVRVGAYVEDGRDSDFCPRGVTWRFPKYESYNPLVFFIATCPTCAYSREFNDAFKNWKTDTTFRTYRLKRIRERHLEELATPGSIIKTLGDSISVETAPNESAIVKLHLAIYDELLNERPSSVDVARLYLRIAWIYRDLDTKSSGRDVSGVARAAEYAARVGRFAAQSEALKQEVIKTLDECGREFDGTDGGTVNTELREIKEAFLAYQMKCLELLEDWRTAVGKLGPVSSRPGDSMATPFGGKLSFIDYIVGVKSSWSDIAVNEREALTYAVERYKKALEEGKEIAAGNQQIQVCYLIGELSRRLGQYQQAREYFNSTLKVGQEFVHQNRNDKSRTALARKILELATEQSQLAREQAGVVNAS